MFTTRVSLAEILVLAGVTILPFYLTQFTREHWAYGRRRRAAPLPALGGRGRVLLPQAADEHELAAEPLHVLRAQGWGQAAARAASSPRVRARAGATRTLPEHTACTPYIWGAFHISGSDLVRLRVMNTSVPPHAPPARRRPGPSPPPGPHGIVCSGISSSSEEDIPEGT